MSVKIEQFAGFDLQQAGQFQDVIQADIFLAALHFADKIAVRLHHLAKRFLGHSARGADGTKAIAER